MTKIDPYAPVTNQMLNEAVEAILQGMDRMIADVAKKDDLTSVEAKLKSEIQSVKTDVVWVKNEIVGLNAELADKSDRKELEKLKGRVTALEQTS
jgi:hypothetical protein